MTNDGKTNSNDDGRISYELIGDSVRIFCRGRRWYANFQQRGRQRRISLNTTSKKEARRRAIRLEANLIAGVSTIATKSPSLEGVIDKYRAALQGRRRGNKTLAKYEYAFQLFLDLAAQHRVKSIEQIDLSFVDAFRAARVRHGGESPASLKTIHNDLVLLRQIVNFAMRRNLIQNDPLRGLQLDKPKPQPQPCWTRDVVERILEAAVEPQRSQLTLLAETGMRVGELRWLTWEDIDLRQSVIHVRPKPDGSWKPKTGDIRVIPISPLARAVLERLPRHCVWVVTAPKSHLYPTGDHQLSERRLLEYLKRVLARLGLRGHLHTFRHAFISHALTRGIPEAIVRQWVGHVDRDIIRQYTHIADSASQAAMQRLASGSNPNLQQSDLGGSKHESSMEIESAQIQHKRPSDKKCLGAKREPATS